MPRLPSASAASPEPQPQPPNQQRQRLPPVRHYSSSSSSSRRTASASASLSSFTTLDDALRSLSMDSCSTSTTPTTSPRLEHATHASTLTAAAPPSFGSYRYDGYRQQQQQQQQQRTRRPSSICPHARWDEQQQQQGELDPGQGHGDEGERVFGRRTLPQRPQQHQHLMTAPALLQTQRLVRSEGGALEEGDEEEEEGSGSGLLGDVETNKEEAQDIVASPQPQQPMSVGRRNDSGEGEGVGLLVRRTASGEEQQRRHGDGEQLDYCDVVASSNHGRPSYATLAFSSFSSSSSGSSSSAASSSSSGSSSTVTAATGFSSATPSAVGRRASAPSTPTLSSSSSWSSFCPLLARLPSYDEENPPPPESPGAAPSNTPGPMHLQLPENGGVGSRRPYTPSPLTPFPHHSQYFRPPLVPSGSSSSSTMRSPSPYAHVTRRASAMAAPSSPASSSRGRDYMNPDTPPRTPPAAAAIMMAALERRRSESVAVMTRKGLGTGSCSPVSGSRTLAVQCASCGRCKPEKSRFCCGWPPVHMVLFHGPSGRGWAVEDKGKRSRAARRNKAMTGGGIH
ncbi:hypothetical protein BKA81DRAFT_33740 [Phyllosticta paracitricarpa]|uniref:Proteophosphoglycan ppg4 n=1 Tax=Phyllosticta paracitricarpa TaxID=2016321 RepID=A0ABR1MXV1_9PEZI